MKIKTLCIITAVTWLVPIGGCVTEVDPVTGEKTTSLDPNAAATGEAIVEGGIAIAPLFGTAGAAVGGILLGVLGAWRKIKPSLMTAKTEAEQYHAAASAVVTGLEEFKETNPEAWTQVGKLLSEQMKKQGIDPKTIENVIRALRGLPPRA